jgi:hypothetical protein
VIGNRNKLRKRPTLPDSPMSDEGAARPTVYVSKLVIYWNNYLKVKCIR